jgi:hypothetical protein
MIPPRWDVFIPPRRDIRPVVMWAKYIAGIKPFLKVLDFIFLLQ